MSDYEARQQRHFDAISERYEAHYDDLYSQRYRARFMNAPMLDGIPLAGRDVIEAMCGSGQTTGDLLDRGARVTGVDISGRLIESFRKRWPTCEGVSASILDTGLDGERFDCAVVVGGLHHLHPHVDGALAELHRVLRPGGHLCFCEPHVGALPDVMRRWWYRRDHYFEDNEASIDVEALHERFADRFEVDVQTYHGGVAYLPVLNSLILRIPLGLKRLYSPLLMALESGMSGLHTRRLSFFVTARWRKRGGGAPIGPGEAR